MIDLERRLIAHIHKANCGVEMAQHHFQDLGLNPNDLVRLDSEAALPLVGEAIARMSNANQD